MSTNSLESCQEAAEGRTPVAESVHGVTAVARLLALALALIKYVARLATCWLQIKFEMILGAKINEEIESVTRTTK